MRLFRFSQKAANVMRDIRRYAIELEQEVEKAFDLLLEERNALKKIDYIKGIEDYEKEWRRILENLEYMKSLASLTARGDKSEWVEVMSKGLKRQHISSGIDEFWTQKDKKEGKKNRNQPKTSTPISNRTNGKPQSQNKSKPTKNIRIPNYNLDKPGHIAYMLEKMLAKADEKFPRNINRLDESWIQAIIGKKVVTELKKAANNANESLESWLTVKRLSSIIPNIKSEVDTKLASEIQNLFDNTEADKRTSAWEKEVKSVYDQVSNLIDDIRSRSPRSSSLFAELMKYAAPQDDPRTVDPQTQIEEIYDDFLAIKDGERINKAFSVSTNRIQKIVTYLYQQANKLYNFVDDTEDKKSVEMVLGGMRWMAKIAQILQMRGRDGAREWDSVKDNGLDQLEMAGIEEEQVDIPNPPPDPPAPNSTQGPKPDSPKGGSGGTKQTGGDPAPSNDGGQSSSDVGTQQARSTMKNIIEASANPELVLKKFSSMGNEIPNTIEDRIWYYFASLVYDGGGVVVQTMMDQVMGEGLSANKDDAIERFDQSFERGIEQATMVLDPVKDRGNRIVEWAVNPPEKRNEIVRNAQEMIRISKLREQLALPSAEKDIIPFNNDSLSSMKQSVVSKISGTKDIRNAMEEMDAQELIALKENGKEILMDSEKYPLHWFARQILQDMGYGPGGNKNVTPEEGEKITEMTQKTLEVIDHLIFGPEMKQGEIPGSFLEIIDEVFSVLNEEQLKNLDMSSNVAREVMNKFMRSLRRAYENKGAKAASITADFKRFGIKGKIEDFV